MGGETCRLHEISGEEKVGSMRSLDQRGGEIGSKRSMKRGSELLEISGEGEIKSHEISGEGERALLDK